MQIRDLGYMSADGEMLPSTLYHGTSASNAENILKVGLDPARTLDRGQDSLSYVFLSWTKQGAAKFAPGGAYNDSAEMGVVLAIDLDEELASHMIANLGEFVRCPVLIPPNKIRVV